nr:TPA_asm: hypothetical protein HUJ06_026027 [Nelumbo nucifera]
MMAVRVPKSLLLACWISLLLPLGQAVWLSIPKSGAKCVSEEIQNNIVVLADYTVVSEDGSHQIPLISCKV